MRSTILENALKYFSNERDTLDRWITKYKKAEEEINHDEPWLTLYSMYGLFGNLNDVSTSNRIAAFNKLLHQSGMKNYLSIDEIHEVQLEKMLPEIAEYRKYLYACLERGNYHIYPDRIEALNAKLQNKSGSLEGNTTVDVFITASLREKRLCLFFEAKYLSDISYQITYNPARDQVIRSIDAGIGYIKEKGLDYDSFYFVLLTPKMFRIDEYGGNRKSTIEEFCPNKSRLYCYKMLEYKDYLILKHYLPHRKDMTDENWKTIADHIGWITFEDIIDIAIAYNTMNEDEREHIVEFFKERNMIQK